MKHLEISADLRKRALAIRNDSSGDDRVCADCRWFEAAADEIDRLNRRIDELTISEMQLASNLRVVESQRKMVCGLNKQLSDERYTAKDRVIELEKEIERLKQQSVDLLGEQLKAP
jgi:predicted RNase H-like nuclease (RuvC/YqgF family)